jgi:hypothetical protein
MINMKDRILFVTVLCFSLMLSSCNADADSESSEKVKEEVELDYILYDAVSDFVVNNDNTVFRIGEYRNGNEYFTDFVKIDLKGEVSLLKRLHFLDFYQSQLSLTNEGDVFLTAPFHSNGMDKIFRFEGDFSKLNPFYTMDSLSSPGPAPDFDRSRLWVFAAANDKTCFVYDATTNTIKRVFLESKSEVLVAGSGKNEVKDGVGLDAGFSYVTRMIYRDGVLYVVDKRRSGQYFLGYNIRKLEFVNNTWKVTTLASSVTDAYSSLSFDSKGDLYVMILGKGIYKLNLQNNKLTLFKSGEIKVKSGSVYSVIDLNSFLDIKIKNNDLYMRKLSVMMKISDFESKFDALSR